MPSLLVLARSCFHGRLYAVPEFAVGTCRLGAGRVAADGRPRPCPSARSARSPGQRHPLPISGSRAAVRPPPGARVLRRSTMERNATTRALDTDAATNSVTCSSDRIDSGDGTSGTTTAFAEKTAFSATSAAPGGQSRMTTSYLRVDLLEDLRDPLLGLLRVVEDEVEIAIARVRRQHVEVLVNGRADGARHLALPGDERAHAALHLRLHVQQEGRSLPAGSRSHSSTRNSFAASHAKFTAAVVLPTPPLML